MTELACVSSDAPLTPAAWPMPLFALLATPALAMADGTASIRIEGANGTLLTQRTANVPSGDTATLFDSFDADTSTGARRQCDSKWIRRHFTTG